jgi:hypothetical protein
MSDKDYNEFVKQRLDALRETLKAALVFMCACCQKEKPRGEAAGVHHYKAQTPDVQKAMVAENGMPKVATYVLCLECLDSFSEEVIHSKVTSYLGTQGLFG